MVESLETESSEKDKQLADLRKQLADKHEQAKTKSADIRKQDEDIQSLLEKIDVEYISKEEYNHLAQELQGEKSAVVARDSVIKSLEKELEKVKAERGKLFKDKIDALIALGSHNGHNDP